MAEERPLLLGCPRIGGLHTPEFSDPNDGICRACGVSRAGPPVDTVETGYVWPTPRTLGMVEAAENAVREARGYVPLPPGQLSAGFQVEDAFTLHSPAPAPEGGEHLAIEAMAHAEEVRQRKEGEAPRGTCASCGSTLKTQEGLSDKDLEDLAGLTRRASSLLNDPHPGIAMWCVATSDVLNAISAILKRSGI